MLDARVEGDVDVPRTVKVKGTAGLSRSSTLEVQTLSVAPKALENLQKERKLAADHPFLKEMRDRGENLYVVMEVVETVQEVTLERAGKAEGCFSLPFFAPLGLQGSVNHKEAVTIPKGCVLAFRVRQLMVNGKDEWDIPHIYNDSMQTFPPGEKPGEWKFTMIQASDVGEMHEYFKTLKEEVQRETQEMEKLSQVGQSSLLSSLNKLLGKKKELKDLELTLERALDKGHPVTLEALPKDVLLSKEAMGAILYFLGALTGWLPGSCWPGCQASDQRRENEGMPALAQRCHLCLHSIEEDSCPSRLLPLLLPSVFLGLLVIILILVFWIRRKYKARKALRENWPKDSGDSPMQGAGQPQELYCATPNFQKVAFREQESCPSSKPDCLYSELSY